jgi:hypothetical protein
MDRPRDAIDHRPVQDDGEALTMSGSQPTPGPPPAGIAAIKWGAVVFT